LKSSEALRELLAAGKIDKRIALQKIAALLGSGSEEQKLPAIGLLPVSVAILSQHEKWKNIGTIALVCDPELF
jgi:hypothetical protein